MTNEDALKYGYTWNGMEILSPEEARYVFEHMDKTLYKLYSDDTEAAVDEWGEITDEYLYGMEK